MTSTFTRLLMGTLAVSVLILSRTEVRAQDYSPADYIETFKDAAIHHMEMHGCPASVILAVAMHESANGNSRIAQHLNNHFGIKGKNDGRIRSAYKGYESVEESYADFIAFLKRRKGSSQLFEQHEPYDYRAWVRGIARSGYAASPTWASKVLATINRYELYRFDDAPAENVMQIAGLDEEPSKIYVVKKGDTLSAIAKKHQTTVRTIQQNNNMRSTRLQIGQELIL